MNLMPRGGGAVNQFAFLDRDMRWIVEPGKVRLFVGPSSADLPLFANFEIVGETQEVKRAFASIAFVA